MKKGFIFILLVGGLNSIKAQTEKDSLWIFSFEEVEKLHQIKPKPIVVFIYADWCKICFGMKKNTFKNQQVIRLLNENYYFVQLNGEDQKEIFFLGKKFTYKPNGTTSGIHQLAEALGTKDNKVRYPTTVFLNTKFEIDLQMLGHINTKTMIEILSKYLKQF